MDAQTFVIVQYTIRHSSLKWSFQASHGSVFLYTKQQGDLLLQCELTYAL